MNRFTFPPLVSLLRPTMMSSTHDDYTIAWICALPLEAAAARLMLNRTHSPLPNPSTDSNAYELGELDGHYIVITCLPAGVYGTKEGFPPKNSLQTFFLNPPIAMLQGKTPVKIDAKLRDYYINPKDNRLRIERLSGDLLDMQQCYINLSIIEYKQNDQKISLQEQSLSSTFSLPNRLKLRADDPGKEVTLPQLFYKRKLLDCRKAQPQRILIRGRAGVGKTTLCKKIVHDFLHQQMWADLFDRIIWIPLRRLKGMLDLDEFFHQEFFKHEAERDGLVIKLRKTALDHTHKKTLWLLDGLDEVSGYRNPSGADLTEIFNSLLNEDNVIITSRPHAIKLPGLTPFDLELETVGFHLHQVQAYIAKAITDLDTVNQISSFIQSHWLIQGLVRIPIQLDALCYSWDKDFHSGAPLQTMTAVYQAIELKLWKKDILNLEKRTNTGHNGGTAVRKLRTRLQIESQHMKTEMEFLERLTFTGLYSDTIEFNSGHRDWLYEQPEFCEMSDDVLDRLSFLRTSDASDRDKSYHFLHLTFQEYFAAQYFVRCWRSETREPLIYLKPGHARENCKAEIPPEKFLREEKYSGRYDVFWRFVTGLLYSIDKQKVCSFLDKMEEEPRDLLGPAHQRLLMHCFSEVPQLEDSGLVRSSNDSFLDLREKMELGCIQWSHYEDRLLEEMRLCSETEFPEHILCKLLQESSLQRERSRRNKILRALGHRWHMSFNLMSIVTKFMDDNDSDVRRAAINALGTQSPWSPDIFEAMMHRLENDKDLYVRRAAIDALSTRSPWSPDILKAVIHQLENDRASHVRYGAIYALQTQSPWSSDILEAMIRRLESDRDSDVRVTAINALGTQSPWSSDILKAMIRRLESDRDSDVRVTAINALGTQSPWSSDILEAMIRRLENEEDSVAVSKIEALLWKRHEFLFHFFDLNANATSALCKFWVQRSIHEIFACYVHDGNSCFEISDGRMSIPLSEGKIKLLKRILWAETVNSPILRLVYRVRFPFASLES
ncbi:hypothetical protein DPV78_011861 [Talaromyces pinophilus]|nr:hypothetical protein DPV78_011861 [Talaromyces pinophilus]